MIVIGENINASNRHVAEAIISRNEEFFEELTRAQTAAGADFIDVNASTGQGTEDQQIADMLWLIDIVQKATDKPLAIDSDSPRIIEAALGKYQGETVLINSINAEPGRLASVGALAAERKAYLVALVMGSEGIPNNVEQRLDACKLIMDHMSKLGMEAERIFFDPLVLPIAVDTSQGMVTLKTIERIKSLYPDARTVMGVSNVSYGLPNRKTINRTFMVMAAYAGLDAAIIDPLDTKAISVIKIADMLINKDPFCKNYTKAHRKGNIVD